MLYINCDTVVTQHLIWHTWASHIYMLNICQWQTCLYIGGSCIPASTNWATAMLLHGILEVLKPVPQIVECIIVNVYTSNIANKWIHDCYSSCFLQGWWWAAICGVVWLMCLEGEKSSWLRCWWTVLLPSGLPSAPTFTSSWCYVLQVE